MCSYEKISKYEELHFMKTSDETKPNSSWKMEHVVKAALLKSQTRPHEHVQFKYKHVL